MTGPDALTPLDQAHAVMDGAPQNELARLAFYGTLADTTLYLLLKSEPEGDRIQPDIFELSEGAFALCFDTQERLASFANAPVPYAALPGRVLASVLAGRDVGLALNPETAPSSILLPSGVLGWLDEFLTGAGTAREETDPVISRLSRPVQPPVAVVQGIGRRLEQAAGLARSAWLTGIDDPETPRLLLGFVDAAPEAKQQLARAVAEALAFAGLSNDAISVGFFESDSAETQELETKGIGFDMTLPEPPERPEPAAPGSDPLKPPVLR